MKLAFYCGPAQPDNRDEGDNLAEWSVVEVDATTIKQGWQLAASEMFALGWPRSTKMYFLGHSV